MPFDSAQDRPSGTVGQSSGAVWAADPWLSACLAFVEMKHAGGQNRAMSNEDRIMMTIVERVDFLRTVEMFSLVRTEYLAKIAAVAKERALAAGETLSSRKPRRRPSTSSWRARSVRRRMAKRRGWPSAVRPSVPCRCSIGSLRLCRRRRSARLKFSS
jgi:hypothetical protein